MYCNFMAFGYVRPGGSVVKNPPANSGAAERLGLITEYRRSPGEENGNPLQYSCLENPMDRGAWWAIVHGIIKSQTALSDEHPQRPGKEACSPSQ